MLILERPASSLVRIFLFDKDEETGAHSVVDIAEFSLSTSRRTQNTVLRAVIDKALHLWSVNDMFGGAEAVVGWSRDDLTPAKRERESLLIQIRAMIEGPL